MGPVGQPRYSISEGKTAKAKFHQERKFYILEAEGLLLEKISDVSIRSAAGLIFRESIALGGWR